MTSIQEQIAQAIEQAGHRKHFREFTYLDAARIAREFEPSPRRLVLIHGLVESFEFYGCRCEACCAAIVSTEGDSI